MTLLNQTKLSVTELHYKISIHRHQAAHNVNVISQPQMFRKEIQEFTRPSTLGTGLYG